MPFSSKSADAMEGKIVIVGAGECGTRAALALRENGFEGTIELIGSERHLPYERPPLSKAVLMADDAPAHVVANEERLSAAGIAHRAGLEVQAIDRAAREVVCAGDVRLPYAKLLLATGARPRKLERDGVIIPGIDYLRTMDDCLALRGRLRPGSRLLVIGGGFLGLEIAAAADARGVAVTVIETQPRILMRGVPEEIAAVVAARHAAAGVAIHCGVSITSIGATRVRLADSRAFAAETLVASVGAIPNTELALAAGLAVANGIVADKFLMTSDPHIYAAGDCCAFPLASGDGRMVRLESWRNATDQAQLVAANLLGGTAEHASVPWFWSDQFDLTLQVAGLAEPSLETVRRDMADGAFILFHLDGSGRLVAASGIGTGGAVARDIRLAEMLIARRARPDPKLLASSDAKLKAMLAA
jgi:3-phenylpropionate/trans-cinnamate dioxygenase ferredoxin reductase subunit